MKSTFLHSCCLLLLAASASAEIIGVEQFDYANGSVANQTGGTFWDWQNRNTPAPGPRHTGTVSDWDNFSGAPLVTNGRLVTDNTSAKREYNGPGEGPGGNIETDEGYGAINNFSNGTISFQQHAVYYRVTFTTGATVPSFISISSSDFGTDRVVFGSGVFTGDPRFAIGDLPANAYTLSGTATSPATNTTYTLVAKLDFVSGKATLYLNPDLNAAESSQTPLRGPLSFSTAFWSSSVRLASGTGGAVTWDDLVVATTWDDLGTVVTTTADEDNGSLLPAAGGGAGVSLREAVKYSPSGTLITFDPALSGKTLTLNGSDLIPAANRTLTIDASALPLGFTIDGNGTSRLFTITSGQTLTLRALTLTGGNGAGAPYPGFGGALYNDAGFLRVLNCTLTGNRGNNGGAVFSSLDSTLSTTLDRCAFSGNSATQLGGAIYNFDGSTLITACTISGNDAPSGGGALASYGDTQTETLLDHTIVSANTGGDVQFVVNMGNNSFTSQGYNLIGNGNATGDFNQAGDQVGVTNPKLSPLGYFGGPTQTMHPLIGSAAIDAGGTTNPGTTDQRGFARFIDGDSSGTAQLDIGAVEAGRLFTVGTPGDGGGDTLRFYLGFLASQPPGTRLGFDKNNFPSGNITLGGTELSIPATLTGLFIDGSTLTGPVTISGNNASRVFNIAPGATVAMQNLVIINGRTANGSEGFLGGDGSSGGGIFSAGSLSLFSCSMTGNRTGDGGSGTELGGSGGYGGGISSDGRLSLVSCRITGNQTGHGGDASIGGSGGSGGGINSGSGPLSLISCSVVGNQTGDSGSGSDGSGGFGGGISSSGDLYLTSSTVSGNITGSGISGGGLGGGVSALRSVIRSSTIAGNKADEGAGLFIEGSLLLDQDTIAGNSAVDGGGILGNLSSTALTLRNSIVAANSGGSHPDLHYGAVTYQGANLVGNISGPDSQTGPAPLTGNALLAPLGNYGGPTQTMPPLPGSPAIDAGGATSLTTDQRGFARSIGTAPDLGAVEVQVGAAVAPALKNITRTNGGGGTNVVQFTFTNTPTADFTVLTSTNLVLPLTNWTVLGKAQQTASGQFHFTDTQTTNIPKRFYRVKSP